MDHVMNHRKVTLWQLGIHEFYRALRVLTVEIPKIELLSMLLEKRSRELANCLKTVAIVLVGVLFIKNQEPVDAINLTFFSLQVNVPVPYATFFLSVLFLSAILSAKNYFTINEFIRVFVNRYFCFDNATAFSIPYDGTSAYSLGVVMQYRFFESSVPHKAYSWGILLLLLAPVAVVICFLGYSLFELSIKSLFGHSSHVFALGLSILSMLLLTYPLVSLVLVLVPFRFKKNTRFIRWLFLLKLHRRAGATPSRIKHWI